MLRTLKTEVYNKDEKPEPFAVSAKSSGFLKVR